MPSTLLNSRAVLLLLVLLNLAFLAWATLIDRPLEPAPPPAAVRNLPKLVLVGEAQPNAPAAAPAPAPPAASPAPPPATASPPSAEPPSAATPAGSAGAAASAPATAAVPAAPSPPLSPPAAAAVAGTATTAHCVTVGPFNDLARVAQGAELLRRRGFSPRQRAEEGEPWSGFWVYVGRLTSEAQQADVLRRLKKSGIQDAQLLPESDGQRRVSVGLFSERAGAESRAKAVRKLGFATEVVEHKQVAAAYWVDLDLATSNQTLPMEGLLSLEEAGARLEIRECPARAAHTGPQTAQTQPAK